MYLDVISFNKGTANNRMADLHSNLSLRNSNTNKTNLVNHCIAVADKIETI